MRPPSKCRRRTISPATRCSRPTRRSRHSAGLCSSRRLPPKRTHRFTHRSSAPGWCCRRTFAGLRRRHGARRTDGGADPGLARRRRSHRPRRSQSTHRHQDGRPDPGACRSVQRPGRLQESYADLEQKVEQRTHELTEALEQQTATAEVLRAISSSQGDLQPVFETILEKAGRLSDAKFGNIYRLDGDALRLVATYNTPAAFAEFRRKAPFRPDTESLIGRMVRTRAIAHVADAAQQQGYINRSNPSLVASVVLGGVRRDARRDHGLSPGSPSLHRQTDRNGYELRFASRDRDRKCATTGSCASAPTTLLNCSSNRPRHRTCCK